jgi:hypothetical protein
MGTIMGMAHMPTGFEREFTHKIILIFDTYFDERGEEASGLRLLCDSPNEKFEL